MRIRKLSEVFWSVAPNLFFFSLVLSAIVGLSYAMLIPFLLYSADSDYNFYLRNLDVSYEFFSSATAKLALIYFGAILSIVLFKTITMVISTFIGAMATVKIRVEMCRRIHELPITTIEKVGHAKLINLINIDIPRLTNAALNLPTIWVSIVTILGVLGYLLYINVSMFLFVLVTLVVAIVTYQLPLSLGSKYLTRFRSETDKMQAGCRGLILGAKELKLDEPKFQEYLKQEIIEPEKVGKKSYIKGMSFIHLGENYGDIIAMIVVGIAVFHLPYIYDINQVEIFATVMALLYLTGPVGMILGSMGAVEMGNISLRKINDFYEHSKDESIHASNILEPDWSELHVQDVEFKYPDSEDRFSVGPASFTLKRGQINFIVGGNGSGKSTISKVISTHYALNNGDIKFDSQSIKELELNSVRESISAIYTDFYVFPSLYKDVDDSKVNEALRYLKLDQKVKWENNRFSTTSLSDGQKKRLALVSALMDDRSICIFDEWAADQDPQFKEFFYKTTLLELKRKNKLVIVISHDDRYFDFADQVITMENGKVRKITRLDSSAYKGIEGSKEEKKNETVC